MSTGQDEPQDHTAEENGEAADQPIPVEPETVRLIRLCQKGDRNALEALFERYLPRVRQIVALKMQRPVHSLATQEDILQESLMRACRNVNDFDTRSAGTFYAYVSRCVQTAIIDALRSEGAQRRGKGKVNVLADFDLANHLRVLDTRTPSAIVGDREMSLKLEKAMLCLKEKDRNLLVYRYLCDMSYAEIAAEFSIDNVGAVRVACLHARRRLAAALSA